MTPKEFLLHINEVYAEIILHETEIRNLRKDIRETAELYAREHTPETGLVPGQKVQMKHNFHPTETITTYFSHAETNMIHPDGSLNLYFNKAKKDGSRSKVIDHNLTINFKVKEQCQNTKPRVCSRNPSPTGDG